MRIKYSKQAFVVVAVIAAIAVVLCVVFAIVLQRTTSKTTKTGASAGIGYTCDAVSIAERVMPSVITIHVQSQTGETSSGSGQFIDSAGHVLTNDHVISAAAKAGEIVVVSSDGSSYEAKLVGRATKLDLAVLKVAGSHPAISIGKSDTITVGQPVVALGAPLGLSSTVTSGIVSALGRQLELPTGDGTGTAQVNNAIQTDASINPGNSGGALVNCTGELVGVNTAIATVPTASGDSGGGNVGIGFAIPSDTAMQVASEIIKDGNFTPPSFGAVATPVKVGDAVGLYITKVIQNGAADKAGLRYGDVVTSVRGLTSLDADSLVEFSLSRKAGDVVSVTYLRDGRQHSARVTLQ